MYIYIYIYTYIISYTLHPCHVSHRINSCGIVEYNVTSYHGMMYIQHIDQAYNGFPNSDSGSCVCTSGRMLRIVTDGFEAARRRFRLFMRNI